MLDSQSSALPTPCSMVRPRLRGGLTTVLLAASGVLMMHAGCTAQEVQGGGKNRPEDAHSDLKPSLSFPDRRGLWDGLAAAKPVSEQTARNALVGQTISRDPGATNSESERFAPDGRWLLMALASAEGRYAIRGNQICVTVTIGKARPGCRYLFKVGDQLVLSTSSDHADIAPENSIPVAYDGPASVE